MGGVRRGTSHNVHEFVVVPDVVFASVWRPRSSLRLREDVEQTLEPDREDVDCHTVVLQKPLLSTTTILCNNYSILEVSGA